MKTVPSRTLNAAVISLGHIKAAVNADCRESHRIVSGAGQGSRVPSAVDVSGRFDDGERWHCETETDAQARAALHCCRSILGQENDDLKLP